MTLGYSTSDTLGIIDSLHIESECDGNGTDVHSIVGLIDLVARRAECAVVHTQDREVDRLFSSQDWEIDDPSRLPSPSTTKTRLSLERAIPSVIGVAWV